MHLPRRHLLLSLVALAAPRRKEPRAMSRYHCTRCGRAIFRTEDLIGRVTLWDLGEYRAEAYAIRRAIDPEGLVRYDVSLHQGWYCCRFIMMRMTTDKFGTGDALLVYADSVVEVAEGQPVPTAREDDGQLALTGADYARVLEASADRDELQVVKFGARWCPPCRLVDRALGRIAAAGGLPGVRFFSVDIDAEPTLAGRFPVQSVPFLVFYYRGRPLALSGAGLPTVAGCWVGGLSEGQVRGLCAEVLARARAGQSQVVLR